MRIKDLLLESNANVEQIASDFKVALDNDLFTIEDVRDAFTKCGFGPNDVRNMVEEVADGNNKVIYNLLALHLKDSDYKTGPIVKLLAKGQKRADENEALANKLKRALDKDMFTVEEIRAAFKKSIIDPGEVDINELDDYVFRGKNDVVRETVWQNLNAGFMKKGPLVALLKGTRA